MDPDQTAPIGAVGSESTLFVGKSSKTLQQTTKADEFGCDWRFKVVCMSERFYIAVKTKKSFYQPYWTC